MTELQHLDTLHPQAAVGWLELGNHVEANEELENITPTLRTHPDVLVVRWQIHAKAKQWEGAFEIARTFVETVPEFPNGWIYQAEALRRMPGEGVEQLGLLFFQRQISSRKNQRSSTTWTATPA